MNTSIKDFIPEGKQVISTTQDEILVTYITQVLSISSNLANSNDEKMFPEPKWSQVSDNYASSIGVEKGRAYGTDVFLLYFNNVPVLAYIDGAAVMALDPNTMEARYSTVKNILENLFISMPLVSAKKAEVKAEVKESKEAEVPAKKITAKKTPVKKPTTKKISD